MIPAVAEVVLVAGPLRRADRSQDRHALLVELTFGVDYEDDLDEGLAALLEIAGAEPRVLKDPAPWAKVTATGDFSVFVAVTDAWLPEHFARAEEGGVTDCMTMPWMYYFGGDATLEQKLEGMTRFAEEVIAPLSGTPSA